MLTQSKINEDQSLLKKRSSNNWPILAVYMFSVIVLNMTPHSMSSQALQMQAQMGINIEQYSRLATAPTFMALVCSLFAGALSDKLGVGNVILSGMSIATIALLGRIFASSYTFLFIMMLFVGVGIAFLNSNTSKLTHMWFDKYVQKRVIGFTLAATPIGMTVGLAAGGIFTEIKALYIFNAIPALVLLILWLLLMHKQPSADTDGYESKTTDKTNIFAALKSISQQSFIFFICGCVVCIMACCIVLSMFLPSVLQQNRNVDISHSGIITSFLSAGNIFGTVFGPMICKNPRNYKPFLIITGFITGLGSSLSWLLPTNFFMILSLFITGITMGGAISQLMGSPILRSEIPQTYIGTVGGILSTCQMLGSFFVPTYIIVPLTGGNYSLLFASCGMLMLTMCILVILMPNAKE